MYVLLREYTKLCTFQGVRSPSTLHSSLEDNVGKISQGKAQEPWLRVTVVSSPECSKALSFNQKNYLAFVQGPGCVQLRE